MEFGLFQEEIEREGKGEEKGNGGRQGGSAQREPWRTASMVSYPQLSAGRFKQHMIKFAL